MNAFQAAGIDPSIPWYQVLGNHDQHLAGSLAVNDHFRAVEVGSSIQSVPDPFDPKLGNVYMGVVDGTTCSET